MSSSRPMRGPLTIHEEAREIVAPSRGVIDLAHRLPRRDILELTETTEIGRQG